MNPNDLKIRKFWLATLIMSAIFNVGSNYYQIEMVGQNWTQNWQK